MNAVVAVVLLSVGGLIVGECRRLKEMWRK